MIGIFEREKSRIDREKITVGFLRVAAYVVILVFALIMGRIIVRGAPVIAKEGLSFFSERPQILFGFYDGEQKYHRLTSQEFRDYEKENPNGLVLAKQSANYSGGGIFSPLVGTIILILICIILAMSVGIAAAIFLSEYARRGPLIRAIRLAIINLAGVPSIVFGLFGLAFFCYFFPVVTKGVPADRAAFFFGLPDWFDLKFFGEQLTVSFQGWEPSMISAGCTLACMVLPIVITACEESLRAVPQGFRDASLALGATQWQSVRKSVLPYALPGMLTASVLSIMRVAGETAPIMYTGAFATGDLPWVGLREDGFWRIGEFFQRGVEAMPYHIYIVSAKIPQSDLVRPMQDGAVLVFMMIVMLLATASVALRMRIRKKMKW